MVKRGARESPGVKRNREKLPKLEAILLAIKGPIYIDSVALPIEYTALIEELIREKIASLKVSAGKRY